MLSSILVRCLFLLFLYRADALETSSTTGIKTELRVFDTEQTQLLPNGTEIIIPAPERNRSATPSARAKNRATCIYDKELDKLVESKPTRSVMYLLTHSEISEYSAQNIEVCHSSWVKRMHIPTTHFFHGIAYLEALPKKMNEWINMDYVIIQTPDHLTSGNHYKVGLNDIKKLLKAGKQNDYDLIPFYRTRSGLMSSAVRFHGEAFRNVWEALLLRMGYSYSDIRALDEVHAFYRNVFIIKPKILKSLIGFMQKAIEISTIDSKVNQLMHEDAKFEGGTEQIAMKVFGTPYYQLFPFVFERLPSFYLYSMQVSICQGEEGPCKFNHI